MTVLNKIKSVAKKSTEKTIKWAVKYRQNNASYGHNNPFLDGPFAPARTESFFEHLRVEGTIPPELDGALMRAGPNPISSFNPKVQHWFAGDGLVHALRIKDGQALWYRSRFAGTNDVNKMLNRPILPGERRGASEVVNTNIVALAGKLWTTVEAGAYPIQLDADLNSVRHQLIETDEDLPFSGHPHVDPDTGEIHAVCYDALVHNYLFYIHLNQDGTLKHSIKVPVKHGPMVHDCAITKTKAIILDLSVTFSLPTVIEGGLFPFKWNPNHPSRIGLLPFGGEASDIQWFSIDQCFIFHTLNAYDLDNGDVVMDAVVFEKALVNDIQGPTESQVVKLERFIFEKATGKTTRRVLSDIPQEFPRIDERLSGRPHRYGYSVTVGNDATPNDVVSNNILVHDLQTGEVQKRNCGDNFITGEVVFVPRHKDAAENEGWLMSYHHAIDCSPSKVVIFDAQNILGDPVATIYLPVRVPVGFHCNWIPASSYN